MINYDYTGSWSALLGPNTPLASYSGAVGSVATSLPLFSTVPSNKVLNITRDDDGRCTQVKLLILSLQIVLGFANYGRSFKLLNDTSVTFGSKFNGMQ